ncbi:MAG: FHA domain-containing protein [Planctomycetaceae bacterium]
MDVRFVILAKPGSPNRDKFRRLPAVVGRAEDVALRLPADYVSRRHCELLERDGGVVLRDLGSTNGTTLDGARVAAGVEVAVVSGSTIQIGGYRIRVEYGTSGTTAVASPATHSAPDEIETVPLSDEAAPPAADEQAWPMMPESTDDGDLDSFFKSLS